MDTLFLESFDLNPMAEFEIFNHTDTTAIYEEYIREASTGTTKKNVFQKLADLIRKLIDLIVKGIRRIISFVQSLFKKNAVPADECMSSAGITPISDENVEKMTVEDNSKKEPIKKVKLKVEKDENTVLDYDVAVKDLDVRLNTNTGKVEIELTHSFLMGFNYHLHKHDIHGKDMPRQSEAPAESIYTGWLFLYDIADNDKHGAKALMIKILENIKSDNIDIKTLENDLRKLKSIRLFPDAANMKMIDLEGIRKMSSSMDEIHELMTSISIDKFDANTPSSVLDAFNIIAATMSSIQFTVNRISNTFAGLYQVDAKYIGTVKTSEELDRVVYSMIKAHIPSKFIAWNAVVICTPKMRKYSNEEEPKMGQTRLVMIPDGKIKVYKIALNAVGINDLKKDIAIYNKLKEKHYDQYIARPIGIEKNACVSTNEYANTNMLESSKNKIALHLQDILQSDEFVKKVGFRIDDLHTGNVGKVGNRDVAIDYSYIQYGN